MSNTGRKLLPAKALAVSLGLGLFSAAMADTAPIKIGVIIPMSGEFAEHGVQYQNGIKLFIKQFGDTVAGHKIEIIYRDEKAPAPAQAKQLATTLLNNDKVNMLAGFDFTPNAMAVSAISQEAKVPMVVMNATGVPLPSKSPYIVRVSSTQPQVSAPMAKWAAENGIKKIYTLVADYSPGYDSEGAFTKALKAAGGTIVGSARVPVSNPDFGPFLQRIKDAHPDAVFFFDPPPGGLPFMKEFVEKQLGKSGIKLLSTGDFTEETSLPALGKNAVGTYSSHHYTSTHNSALNKKFVATYHAMFGKDRYPNFYAVGAYDGMHVIYEALKKTNGDTSGEKFAQAVKGMSFESPRGPVLIDAATRDVVQTVYIRKTEMVKGVLQNVELKAYPNQKPSGNF